MPSRRIGRDRRAPQDAGAPPPPPPPPPPTPPVTGAWPNETTDPMIVDTKFAGVPIPSADGATLVAPWAIEYQQGGRVTPSLAGMRFNYTGISNGSSPATVWMTPPKAATQRLYYAMKFVVSNPWVGSGNGQTKLLFTNNQLMAEIWGDGTGPFTMGMWTSTGNFRPNKGSGAIALGQPHTAELLIDGPAGRIAWWLDGGAVGDYSGYRFSAGALSWGELRIYAGYGGTVPPPAPQWIEMQAVRIRGV